MTIKQRRLDKGWSQEQLAELAGVSVRTIQRIENQQQPSLESLKCLAAVFETSVSELSQEMGSPKVAEYKAPTGLLYQIERDAIEFAQSILNGAKKGQKDPISSIERDAINHAKGLLARFNVSD
ncbi:helix-turn-helix transcriptional regulator [Thalassotalea sp. LPB0316]|uniref:helix-turn-helix domain-containing protein n=1 Tax=Thalassotalea sp. LPB0316 TaxID=2769490 RepID=UPI001865C066|nr:helix-turn-helix transcriptional regulator [Thalassotalea sp. LPB0316]QOL25534.1 helix-turn-helix transcriptional regulator [Thalassotalea sp. LPB0316]